ncbi:uncharacterized protein F4812DRAFT_455099 [Daldinia caldariorum]|uniref:uncharacterized protein n=1 Tax=Daldinia caldariorum TaxID=326644 RepID=UPI002007F894|nr:uncharacterized protein F4812DRAFT_455099 [Daldinia caldariorum]KAI1470988.1 hypothetical protein F4812DRAFT_455099 [Daldinia caldariorum]
MTTSCDSRSEVGKDGPTVDELYASPEALNGRLTTDSERSGIVSEAPSLESGIMTPPTSDSQYFHSDFDFTVESFFEDIPGVEEDLGIFTSKMITSEVPSDFDLQTLVSDSRGAADIASRATETFSTQKANTRCLCFLQAIHTHEAIEVNLVFALQHQSGTAANLLRHQKKCLRECEDLLDCQSCRTKSDYVMLILSMCDKIARNLEKAFVMMLPTCQERDTSYRKRGNSRVSFMDSHQEKLTFSHSQGHQTSLHAQTPQDPGQYLMSTRNGSCNRHPPEHLQIGRENHDRDPERKNTLQIGLWQLDGDDELQVLNSLFTARIDRLRSLLTTLGNLVNNYDWPAHERLVDDIRRRLTESFCIA